jgi:hypothetical protein
MSWIYRERESPQMAKKQKNAEPSLRDKLTSAFIEALEKDWAENGAAVIAAVREENPVKYSELIVRLVPVESSLIAPGDFSQCQSAEEIGRKLLLQVGVDENGVTPDMIDAACRANDTFINELQRIGGGN